MRCLDVQDKGDTRCGRKNWTTESSLLKRNVNAASGTRCISDRKKQRENLTQYARNEFHVKFVGKSTYTTWMNDLHEFVTSAEKEMDALILDSN